MNPENITIYGNGLIELGWGNRGLGHVSDKEFVSGLGPDDRTAVKRWIAWQDHIHWPFTGLTISRIGPNLHAELHAYFHLGKRWGGIMEEFNQFIEDFLWPDKSPIDSVNTYALEKGVRVLNVPVDSPRQMRKAASEASYRLESLSLRNAVGPPPSEPA